MQRRAFITAAGTTAIGAMMSPSILDILTFKENLKNIGLQLYTVRDDMASNPVNTLRKVAELGFKHVECAGYSNGKFYGMAKQPFKSLLDDLGLKMHSGHAMTGFGMPEGTYSMSHNWDFYCEDAAEMGQKYIVSAYFMPDERKTIDDFKRHAELFNKCAETAAKYNLVFCHHNHDFEFLPIDGVVPYDIILSQTDASMVKMELDHYWTTKANVNTKKLIAKNQGRFPLFHIKDMDKTADQSFTEVGSGVIKWNKVFELKKKAGMEFFYVEQDVCKNMEPLKSIEVSINYLKSLQV